MFSVFMVTEFSTGKVHLRGYLVKSIFGMYFLCKVLEIKTSPTFQLTTYVCNGTNSAASLSGQASISRNNVAQQKGMCKYVMFYFNKIPNILLRICFVSKHFSKYRLEAI